MTTVMARVWCLIAGVFLCFAPSTFAACPSSPPPGEACMNLTSGGPFSVAGDDVGPYYATINGVPTQVICDDFADDSYLNQPWPAAVNTPSTALTLGKFANSPSVSAQQGYAEVADLSLQMLHTIQVGLPAPGLSLNDTVGAIDFAIWNVFDPGVALADLGIAYPGSTIYNTALGYYKGAVSAYSSNPGQLVADFSLFTIYTPVPANGPPQEFLAYTPEPRALAQLGIDLSGVVALAFLFRRRARRSLS